jgi:hypothetical protein
MHEPFKEIDSMKARLVLCSSLMAILGACGDATQFNADPTLPAGSSAPAVDEGIFPEPDTLAACTQRWDALHLYQKGDTVSYFHGNSNGAVTGRIWTATRSTVGEAPGATYAWSWTGETCAW